MTSLLFQTVTSSGTQPELDALLHLGRETFTQAFGHNYTAADLNAYLEQSFNPEQIAREWADPQIQYTLVYWNSEPVGYFKWVESGRKYLPESFKTHNPLYLERFYFLESCHGLGLAAAALHFIVGQAKQQLKADYLYLTVWENNLRGQNFYQKHGLRVIGQCEFPVGKQLVRHYVYSLKLN